MNDLAYLGNTVPGIEPFAMAQRMSISRWRAGAIFENDDPTVVLGGATWTRIARTDCNSGTSLDYTPTIGATITITTPQDFPGGTIALGFTQWGPGDSATVSGTVNGTVYTVNTNHVLNAVGRTCSVLRVPNIPAGTASYVFTVTGNVGGGVGCMFDYWQWEANDAPLIVLVKQPKPIDLNAYGAGVVTNAGIDALNGALDALATEFGPRVITVDTSSIDADPTCFIAGNVHPTPKGHRIIAEKIRDAVKGIVTPIPQRSIYALRIEYGTAAPTGADRWWYVGDRVENISPTAGGYMGWVCTVAGAPGTWKTYGPITA
jgi:hypothetical protein